MQGIAGPKGLPIEELYSAFYEAYLNQEGDEKSCDTCCQNLRALQRLARAKVDQSLHCLNCLLKTCYTLALRRKLSF